MRVSFVRGLALALGLVGWSGLALADGWNGSPSLLPYSSARPIASARVAAGTTQHATVGYFDRYDAAPNKAAPLPSPEAAPSPSDRVVDEGSSVVHQGNGGCQGGCNVGSGMNGGGNAYAGGSPYAGSNGYGVVTNGANWGGDDVCAASGSCWFGGVYAMTMTRDRENFHQLSFDDTDPVGQVLSTHSAYMSWSTGVEARFGRYFCDGEYALELVYWGIFSDPRKALVTSADVVGNLNTVYDFTTLVQSTAPGTTINDFFDAAEAHCVSRTEQIHNVELNLVRGNFQSPSCCGPQSMNLNWFGGVRYFRFAEDFMYHTSDGNVEFDVDRDNEYYYDIDVANNLIGFQVGARADYCLNDCWKLHIAPKVGIYGNHMSHYQRIYNDTSVAVVGVGNPLAGEEYSIDSSLNDVAMMAEIDLGLTWRLNNCWSVSGGYRAVGITGLALSTNQIPDSFADIPGVQDIDSNGSLILHGAYLGAEYNW